MPWRLLVRANPVTQKAATMVTLGCALPGYYVYNGVWALAKSATLAVRGHKQEISHRNAQISATCGAIAAVVAAVLPMPAIGPTPPPGAATVFRLVTTVLMRGMCSSVVGGVTVATVHVWWHRSFAEDS
jgi:hypothetical protein